MKFKEYLNEEWAFNIKPIGFKSETKVFINPNVDELYKEMKDDPIKEVRGIYTLEGDLYVWSAMGAIHDEVERKIDKLEKCIRLLAMWRRRYEDLKLDMDTPMDKSNKNIFKKQQVIDAETKFKKIMTPLYERLFTK